MKTCPWESIDDFRDLIEFERFEKWMNGQIVAGQAVEVSVTVPYLGEYAGFREKQFCHIGSKTLWRLVWPDGPFHGLFEKVALQQN